MWEGDCQWMSPSHLFFLAVKLNHRCGSATKVYANFLSSGNETQKRFLAQTPKHTSVS